MNMEYGIVVPLMLSCAIGRYLKQILNSTNRFVITSTDSLDPEGQDIWSLIVWFLLIPRKKGSMVQINDPK